MSPDPIEIAREAVALAEKATPGPWRGDRWDGTAKYAVLAPLDPAMTEYRAETADKWEPVLTLNHKSGEYGFTGHKDGEAEWNERLVIHAGTHYAAVSRALLAKDAEVGRLREALERLIPIMENASRDAFKNGVTDPTGSMDQGDVWAGNAIDAARAVLALTEERDALRERLRECCATFDGFIPDRNCCCHINAPCNDCVDWGGPRQVIDEARAALRGKEGT